MRPSRIRSFGLGLCLTGATLAGCSGSDSSSPDTQDGGDDEPTRSTVVGHADAIPAPDLENPELEPVVALWMDAGADESLAVCYADMLEAAGLSDGIEDLNDLSAAQGAFTPEQSADFAACGT